MAAASVLLLAVFALTVYAEPSLEATTLLQAASHLPFNLRGFGGRFNSEVSSKGRVLLAAAPQCVWSPQNGCDLNPNYITSLNGTPATDSQRFLAKYSQMNNVCITYNTSTACTSKPAELCKWDSVTSTCIVGNGIIDQQWLRGKAYCPGSLADLTVICTALTSQTACGGNSNCVWQSASQLTGMVGLFLSSVSSWTGAAAATASGACAPTWATNSTVTNGLINKIFSGLNVSLTSLGSSGGASSFMIPLFNDLFGNCTGVAAYKNILVSCSPQTNKSACDAVAGCAWTASSAVNVTTNGKCDIGADFATSLFLDSTDPWVKALNTAGNACATQAASAACTGLGTINVDPTKYTTTYAGITLTFPTFGLSGSASAAGVSSMLLSLLAGLACLMALLA